MSQDNATANAQAANEGGAQAANTNAQAANEPMSLDEARKLRSEAASLRKREKDALEKLAALENAKLTEAEKLQKAHDDLLKENTALKTEAQTYKAQQAAAANGAIYPDLVASKISAEALADKKTLDKEIAQLKIDYPSLFNGRGSADGGAGVQRPGNTQGMNDMIRRAAGRG